ncbi:MAG: hypothetical protein EOP05_01995 [Proteobacteria bacterium]|nr:MAG: hypothetical protein EOP05_01995 [Pseudomonadota bacterium]
MEYLEKQQIFNAQVQNVRMLNQAFAAIVRQINSQIRKGDEVGICLSTRLLLLTFDAWSEATFSKMIHSTGAFESSELIDIKACAARNIIDGWHKCIGICFEKAKNHTSIETIEYARSFVQKSISEDIVSSRRLRNKIAHGQWQVALNRSNDDIDHALTLSLQNLDPVEIIKLRERQMIVSQLVEDLVESPGKAFPRDCWNHYNKLREYIARSDAWTLVTKRSQLNLKTKSLRAKTV